MVDGKAFGRLHYWHDDSETSKHGERLAGPCYRKIRDSLEYED